MKKLLTLLPGVFLLSITASACANDTPPDNDRPAYYDYRVVNTYPHDTGAFTQGLFFDGGVLYESTGIRGQSSLRKLDIDSGEILQQVDLPAQYFGEGAALWDDEIITLTWRAGTGLVYDLDGLALTRTFTYEGEGWGLTHDGERLIMSDGSATLRFLDPQSFEVIGRLDVAFRGKPLVNINELEWINGEIFANVWRTNVIVRINPETGAVAGVIDMRNILPTDERIDGDTNVLNGIAYDADADRIFVTGKNWPKLYEIELVPRISK